jgi:hypothetical protein
MIKALKNKPTVMPIATWIMLYPTLKTMVLRSVAEVTETCVEPCQQRSSIVLIKPPKYPDR